MKRMRFAISHAPDGIAVAILLLNAVVPSSLRHQTDNEIRATTALVYEKQLSASILYDEVITFGVDRHDSLVADPDDEVGIEIPGAAAREKGDFKAAASGVSEPDPLRLVECLGKIVLEAIEVTVALVQRESIGRCARWIYGDGRYYIGVGEIVNDTGVGYISLDYLARGLADLFSCWRA